MYISGKGLRIHKNMRDHFEYYPIHSLHIKLKGGIGKRINFFPLLFVNAQRNDPKMKVSDFPQHKARVFQK